MNFSRFHCGIGEMRNRSVRCTLFKCLVKLASDPRLVVRPNLFRLVVVLAPTVLEYFIVQLDAFLVRFIIFKA
ncbi:unnamed protein product [Meloidogyne enterolobii]|uniref:Uncharacterized protein n=1 Tax=Meloidogyne enterolobii TaxID=390850 RepID=A0ACB0YTC8_MELEN